MDPVLIASTVVSALSPYLGKAAGKIAEATGSAAWTKTTELYELLKTRMTGTPGAEHAMKEMEKAPDDASRQAALGGEIKKLIASDPEFMKQVAGLVAEIGHSAGPVFNNQIAGDVGKIVNIGSAGDISIN